MNSNFLLLAQQGGKEGGNPFSTIIFFGLIIVVFYFFMIRPQMKKQKEAKKYRESLKSGDSVVTIGGMYGKIKDVKETTLTIEIATGVLVKVDKSAVVRDLSTIS